MSGDDAARVEKEFGDKVVVQSMPSTSFVCVVFNSKNKPWDNLLVRQAASLAIDRAASLKVAQGGYGLLGGFSMPGPWSLPDEELEKISGYGKDFAANLARAKKLLAEAGFPNGFSTTILVRKHPIFEPVAVFMKDQWAQVGIEAKIDIREVASMNDAIAKKDFQVLATGNSFPANDPDVLGDYITSNGSQNQSFLSNKEVDDLFAKQSQTLDVAERKKLSNTMEKLALSDQGFFLLYWRNRYHGFSRLIHDIKIHPNMDNARRYQNVWLSKG
jgi:peptide/nickel transport system substrate-binding protein